MPLLPGAIRQNAYIVDDVDGAIARWCAIGVGPWYLMREVRQQGYFVGDAAAEPVMTLAFANSGPLQIELIQLHDDTPTAFTLFPPTDPSGYHHLAWWTDDFVGADTHLRATATCVSHGDGGGAARWAYYRLDGTAAPLVELMELNAMTNWMVTTVADAHTSWDGTTDPARNLM